MGFKDFTTKLNKSVRRHVKYMVFMFASDIFASCRFLYTKIKTDALDESITTDMEYLAGEVTLKFVKRCNNVLAVSGARTRYIRKVIKKHILPVINHIFDFYRTKLSKIDTLSILIDSEIYEDHIPRLYKTNRNEQVLEIQTVLSKRITTIVYK